MIVVYCLFEGVCWNMSRIPNKQIHGIDNVVVSFSTSSSCISSVVVMSFYKVYSVKCVFWCYSITFLTEFLVVVFAGMLFC